MRSPYGNDFFDEQFDIFGNDMVGGASRRARKASRRSRKKTSHHTRRRPRRASRVRYSARKGRRGVKYTKNGQPYIIMKSGKARFIKGRRHR